MRVKCLVQEHNTEDPDQGLTLDLLMWSLVCYSLVYCISNEDHGGPAYAMYLACKNFFSVCSLNIFICFV